MTDTTFVAYSNATPITATWLNDVNLTEYHLLGNTGTPPTTVADILANLGANAKYAALLGNAANKFSVAAGAATTDAVNMGQFPSSLGTNGWKKYPDASSPTGYFIEQWGSGVSSATAGQAFSVTFPIAFPNAVLISSAIMGGASATALSIWSDTSATPLTKAVFRSNIASNGMTYRVIGY
jgi:hypothetical protein